MRAFDERRIQRDASRCRVRARSRSGTTRVRRELSQFPEITLDLVREALELASGGGRLALRLNPKDYETLGDHAEQLVARIGQLTSADVVADPAVQPGGCRVEGLLLL